MKTIRAEDLPGSFFDRPADPVVPMVRRILDEVRQNGDRAIRKYTLLFDKVEVKDIRVSKAAIQEALAVADRSLQAALEVAARNIRAFAVRQRAQLRDFQAQTMPGVFCGQRVIPIDRVGIYVPGGRFPLVSSLLMGVIPAQVAGVREIAVCSPPQKNGMPGKAILAAAAMLGVGEMVAVGGVQAIGAMAFGTSTIPRVDKIVGPGNRLVTLAKKEVSGGTGIDMLAGPTEVFIVADEAADPGIIAADMLAQAEHDIMASAVLLTDSPALAKRVQKEIDRQVPRLNTGKTAAAALANNGWIILVGSIEEAASICNRRGPEHLELQVRHAKKMQKLFSHFGTLFTGSLAAEALGDYSSGLNHTLPTGGRARFSAGLSVRDFLKVSTTLRVTHSGYSHLAPAAHTLAEAEGLCGHARSLELREKPFP